MEDKSVFDVAEELSSRYGIARENGKGSYVFLSILADLVKKYKEFSSSEIKKAFNSLRRKKKENFKILKTKEKETSKSWFDREGDGQVFTEQQIIELGLNEDSY